MFFEVFGGVGQDVPGLCGDEEGGFVLVEGVNEGHGAGFNLIVVEQILHIDLPHNLFRFYAPLQHPAIETARDAYFALFGVDKLYGVDDVVVALIE